MGQEAAGPSGAAAAAGGKPPLPKAESRAQLGGQKDEEVDSITKVGRGQASFRNWEEARDSTERKLLHAMRRLPLRRHNQARTTAYGLSIHPITRFLTERVTNPLCRQSAWPSRRARRQSATVPRWPQHRRRQKLPRRLYLRPRRPLKAPGTRGGASRTSTVRAVQLTSCVGFADLHLPLFLCWQSGF